MQVIQEDLKEKEKQTSKEPEYDEDIPVCICGKPYIVKLVSECYNGSGVQCDECGKSLASHKKVYHCPADKNNILHDQGYDVCVNCYDKLVDQVNTENILFQIWFIINCLNKQLYHTLTTKFQINSRKSLISKSSYEIYEFVSSINWNELNDNTTKKLFYDKYDQLRKTHLALKKSAYKFVPQQPQPQPQPQNNYNNNSYYDSRTFSNISNNNNNYYQNNYNNNHSYYSQSSQQYAQQQQHALQQQQQMSYQAPQMRSLSMRSKCSSLSSNNIRKRSHRSHNNNMNNSANLSSHTRSVIQPKSVIESFSGGIESIMDNNIGFSMGGAQDINSFRLCIENKQIPQINSISYQGIFNEYYFDTSPYQQQEMYMDDQTEGNNNNNNNNNNMDMDIKEEKENKQLPIFYPSYTYSKSIIPNALIISNETDNNKINNIHTNDMIEFDETQDNKQFEHFVQIGLNSNISEKDFKRKQLNLVVVLDISGSMGSTFNNNDNYQDRKTKMEVANQCLLLLLTHLNMNDRFGLILFNNSAEIFIQISKMKNLKMEQIEKILKITQRGGTNFEAGYNGGLNMFQQIDLNDNNYENRLIFLTDARPNAGSTDANSLLNLVKKAAKNDINYKRIYTTFVGIGVDFNSDLISDISNVRGCNYFAIHTNKEFKKKLYDEFDYFVSPMVFNLEVTLFCEGSKYNAIENVFGSDNINIKNGEIMNIKTLFPSPPNDSGDIKGGIILIQLNKKNVIEQLPYFVQIIFEDKFGNKFEHKECINLIYDDNNIEIYPNLGIRKGLLLTRYVKLIKNWINSCNKKKYNQIFKEFENYFNNEMKCVKDDNLKQEIKILNQLINW